MSNVEFINFDTFGIPYSQNQNYCSYLFIPGSQTQSPNQFNIDFILTTPRANVKKIYLLSVEMPMGFNNIRSTSNLNFITVNCDGTKKTITIADGTYTQIDSLIADLNVASGILYPSDNIVFSLVNDRMTVTATTFTSVNIVQTNLSYVLGYRPETNVLSSGKVVAGTKFLLSFDTYLNFVLNNTNSSSTNFNGVKSTFKVPIDASSDTIFYFGDNASYSQFCTVASPSVDRISVSILDKFGYNLHSNLVDFSFTLGFVY